jgi:hypothetical protein
VVDHWRLKLEDSGCFSLRWLNRMRIGGVNLETRQEYVNTKALLNAGYAMAVRPNSRPVQQIKACPTNS